MGRDSFTEDELAAIRHLLDAIRHADRDEQKRLRGRLRSEFGFYITDFLTDQAGMTASDLDDLVRRGVIRVGEPPRSAVRPDLRERASSPTSTPWRGDPAELVDLALAGPGRDACVRLCAAAIRAGERIDSTRVAVTPIKIGPRFRVIGGLYQGIAPWEDLLGLAVQASDKSLHAEVEQRGGRIIDPPPPSVRSSLTVGVPRPAVETMFDALLASHVKHLSASIDAGPPTHLNKHDPKLRQFLLDEADRLQAS